MQSRRDGLELVERGLLNLAQLALMGLFSSFLFWFAGQIILFDLRHPDADVPLDQANDDLIPRDA